MTSVLENAVRELQLTEGEIRFYQDEGYLYIPDLVAPEVVSALHDEVLDIMEKTGVAAARLRQAERTADKLIQTGQYLAGSTVDRFVNSPRLLSIAAQLMGGPSSLYLPFTAVKSGGGGGRFHFHQDNQYTRFDGPGINLWCALSPMTPENGCLQVVPRSHLEGTLDSVHSSDGDTHRMVAREPSRFLPVRMRPGDCLAFSRLTIHGSGPNDTPEPRVAYAVQFHRNDVKARWDNQDWRPLRGSHRWNIAPVNEITAPESKSRDGH
jgi:2-oxoglutarate-dependent dioxygenase